MSNEISPVILALAAYLKGEVITEGQHRAIFQFGFLAHRASGRAYLTTAGEEALRDNGLGLLASP